MSRRFYVVMIAAMLLTSLVSPAAESRRTPEESCCARHAKRWHLRGMLLDTCILLGCGRSDRGYVQGTVTLDGTPLPAATIEFQPDSGSPSYGETDASGHCELALSPTEKGAILGNHTIRVSTFRVVPKEEGTREEIPEKVPSSHSSESTLTREVTTGRQTIDIEITTGNAAGDY